MTRATADIGSGGRAGTLTSCARVVVWDARRNSGPKSTALAVRGPVGQSLLVQRAAPKSSRLISLLIAKVCTYFVWGGCTVTARKQASG